MQNRYLTFLLALLAYTSNAQTVYFHQDFSQTTSLINPLPDTGQFSHVILTAPALSYHKFHKGYMELVRSRQDSATGGIIRALRATPFEPNPETLIVRVTFSVEDVQTPALNALYFYVGEDFNPVNNSFPGNGLMFGKCSMNFLEDGFNVKDLETQQVSSTYGEKEKVTLTWVLNNSGEPLFYKINVNGPEQTAAPGTYDLWVNEEAVHRGTPAYPGTSVYSKSKLSNFEMRFRNGVGKIRIDEIRIDDGKPKSATNEIFIAPNPAKRDVVVVSGKGVNAERVFLTGCNGIVLPVSTTIEPGQLRVKPLTPLASGIHILQLVNQDGQKRAFKVMVE